MRISRVMFGGASLLVLLSLFGLGTSCGDEKRKVKIAGVPCDTSVDVDPATGVKQVDIYVCENTTVTWKAGSGVTTFTVYFKNHKCPFQNHDCKNINQDNPTSKPMDKQPHLTVFDYGIIVNGESFDPHVVGGGGS
jgi:hypothetical protein